MSDAYAIPEWTLGDRLRKAREYAGIGVAEMALRVGVSRNTITNYEHDHRAPSVNALRDWAQITGTSVAWLIGIDAEDSSKNRCFPLLAGIDQLELFANGHSLAGI